MSYNIYASSPGILVTAADFVAASAAGLTGPVVLLPYASTIGYELTVKDEAGLASALNPITVSTIVDAYYARTLSTSIISSVQITAAGGSLAVAPLQPRTYTLLNGSFVQREPPSALRPNTESISSISTYTATALSSLTLLPTVSLAALRSFAAPASLTADFTSTVATTLQTTNLYSAYTTGPDPGSILSYFSTGSLSTNVAYATSLAGLAITTSNFTGVGYMDICGGGLTTVGGNYSTVSGGLLTADSSARITGNTLVVGAFSTLGSVVAYGDLSIKDDFYGASNMSVGSLVLASAGVFGSNFYAPSTTLSTLVVHGGAAYTSTLTVGEPAGTPANQALDISGSLFVTGSLTEQNTVNARFMSTGSLLTSTLNLYDYGVNRFRPLYIQGGTLKYDNNDVGSVLDFNTSTVTVSNWTSTQNFYASTAFVGGSTYRTTFQLEVNGGVKITDTPETRLRVAGGSSNSIDTTTTLAWSADGLTWTQATAGGFTTATYGFGWNGRQWLALGADTGGQTIEVSADGKSWSVSGVSNPFTAEGHAAAWNGQRWVAVGAGAGLGLDTIKTSTDGYTWTDAASGGFSNFGYDVAWNGRLWVAVGNSNTNAHSIQYSYDGSNWSNATTGSFDGSGAALAWNGRIWVAVGSATNQNARIKWSANGLNWTDSSGATAFTGFGTDVVWTGQIFTATGSDTTAANRIKFSYDGSFWSNVGSGGFDGLGQAVSYDGNKWIAGGTDTTQNNRIKYSVDGRNWINASGVPFGSGGTNAIAYGYDTVPRLQVAGLEFYDGVNPYLRSTNTIFTQTSLFNSSITHSTSMVINNTLFINPPTGVAINIDTSIASTIALYVNGSTFVNSPNPFKLGGGTWRTPSDSRLKTEIPIVNPMDHFMAKVEATKPKEFSYKDKAMMYVNRGAIERRNNYLQGVKDSMAARAIAPEKIYNIHNEKVAKLVSIDLTKEEEAEKEVGFIAEEVAAQIPEAIEPIEIGGQTYAGLNYEQIHMMHLATTHALMSTMEIQESTLKGQDGTIETLYANYDILRNLLTL